MENLVTLLNKLNDTLSTVGDLRVNTPAVVVLGVQSSGKSSVVEGIVGRDFLPRGSGLVTRCPLELQLVNIQRQTPTDFTGEGPAPAGDEWIEFAHIEKRRFYSFEEARTEIIKQMDRVAGRNKGIVAQPVGLRVFSPRVPDLTLVDLPGLVKTPQGDQPPDIEAQIRGMWSAYTANPNTILLAVHAANTDIHTDDAIRAALEADPDGERTIGVLTKVDLMDPGTDARDVLLGRSIHFKRGFVPVVCRSQKDTAEGVPIERAIQKEARFFARHPAYAQYAHRCGTPHLVKRLTELLVASIRVWLPRFRADLATAHQAAEQGLRELGPPVDPALDASKAGQTVLRLLSRYASNFNDMLEGRVHADASDDVLTQVLFGGARIQEHIRSRFYPTIDLWMDNFVREAHRTLPSAEILMALRNSSGPRPTLFIPELAFVALCRRYIRTLKPIGRDFVRAIYNELRYAADVCRPPELNRFNALRDQAVEVVHDLLHRAYTPTVETVDALIDFELSHVNTLHPDFVGADGAMQQVRSGADLALFASDPWLSALDAAAGAKKSHRKGVAEKDGARRRSSSRSRDDPVNPAGGFGRGAGQGKGRRAREEEEEARLRGEEDHDGEEEDEGDDASDSETEGRRVPLDVQWAVHRMGGVLPGAAGRAGAETEGARGGRRGHGVGLDHRAEADEEEEAEDGEEGEDSVEGDNGGVSPAMTPVRSKRTRAASAAAAAADAAASVAVSSASSQFIRDVHDRYQAAIVPDITGHGPNDPVPAGAVRLGGAHSPYVARPASRYGVGGLAPGVGAGVVGSAASPVRAGGLFGQGGSPASAPSPFSGYGSPGASGVSSVLGSSGPYAAGQQHGAGYGYGSPLAGLGPYHPGAGGASSNYVHFEVAMLPGRPLPAVITPDHLRPTPRERVEIRVIRYLLFSYLQIVRKTYQDIVPKMVMSLLVNKAREEISAELIQRLYTSITQTSRDLLLREADDVAQQRRYLTERIGALRRGLAVLNEVRESTATGGPGGGAPANPGLQAGGAGAGSPGGGWGGSLEEAGGMYGSYGTPMGVPAPGAADALAAAAGAASSHAQYWGGGQGAAYSAGRGAYAGPSSLASPAVSVATTTAAAPAPQSVNAVPQAPLPRRGSLPPSASGPGSSRDE